MKTFAIIAALICSFSTNASATDWERIDRIMDSVIEKPYKNGASYGMHKLKQVITSGYYNARPELQDEIILLLLFDFDGLTDDFETRAQQYAGWWGELRNATPVKHRYYKWFSDEYKYWSDEAERDITHACDRTETDK